MTMGATCFEQISGINDKKYDACGFHVVYLIKIWLSAFCLVFAIYTHVKYWVAASTNTLDFIVNKKEVRLQDSWRAAWNSEITL